MVLELKVEQDLFSEIVLLKELCDRYVLPFSTENPEYELQNDPYDCSQTVIDLVRSPETDPVAPVEPVNPRSP